MVCAPSLPPAIAGQSSRIATVRYSDIASRRSPPVGVVEPVRQPVDRRRRAGLVRDLGLGLAEALPDHQHRERHQHRVEHADHRELEAGDLVVGAQRLERNRAPHQAGRGHGEQRRQRPPAAAPTATAATWSARSCRRRRAGRVRGARPLGHRGPAEARRAEASPEHGTTGPPPSSSRPRPALSRAAADLRCDVLPFRRQRRRGAPHVPDPHRSAPRHRPGLRPARRDRRRAAGAARRGRGRRLLGLPVRYQARRRAGRRTTSCSRRTASAC